MFHRDAEPGRARLPAQALPDVGLYIDDARAIAAVSHPSRSSPSLHVAALHDTVLYLHGDGSASLGASTDPFAAEFTGFVDTIGDEPSPDHAPGDLVAIALRCLLTDVARSIGTEPRAVAAAATFPARWTAEQVSALRIAMNRFELQNVALVPESEARAVWAGGVHATRAGSDSGIAAARGAAVLASDFPVDAVTEAIVRPGAVRPVWTRTPVVVAATFAVVLTVGAGLTAALLHDSSDPPIPGIENAQAVAPTSTPATRSSERVPFPTIVPITEPILLPPATPPTTVTTDQPRPENPAVELPATRPVAETPRVVEQTTTAPEPDAPILDPAPSPEEPLDPEVPVDEPDEPDDTGEPTVEPTDEPVVDPTP